MRQLLYDNEKKEKHVDLIMLKDFTCDEKRGKIAIDTLDGAEEIYVPREVYAEVVAFIEERRQKKRPKRKTAETLQQTAQTVVDQAAKPPANAIPSSLDQASRVTALPQHGEFAVDLPEMSSLPSAASAVKGFWKGGLAFPLVSGLLAGGVSIPLLNRLPSPWSLIVGILVGVALFVKSRKGANRK